MQLLNQSILNTSHNFFLSGLGGDAADGGDGGREGRVVGGGGRGKRERPSDEFTQTT